MGSKASEQGSKRRAGAGEAKVSARQLLLAARRHYDGGDPLSLIAADLGVTGSYLGRLLRSARENGWIRVEVASDPEIDLAAALHDKYPHLVHVEVVQRQDTPDATARAIGMAGARWFNTLLERDEESERFAIKNVAIGGAAPHAVIVEQTLPRRNRISVGPTTLTPERGQVARFTASTLSALLAMKLGAVGPGDRLPPAKDRQGFRYCVTVDPPMGDAKAMRAWVEALHERSDFKTMLEFWDRLDVAFISAVGTDWAFPDVKLRLGALGTSVSELEKHGAVAITCNQFVNAEGEVVPVAPGLPTYEPAIAVEALRTMARRADPKAEVQRYVVLDLWGDAARKAFPLAASGVANVLLCDAPIAEFLLTR